MNDLIQKGITGFSSTRNNETLEDTKSFLTCIHSIMQGKVEWEDIDIVGKNYYWFLVSTNDQEFSFFLNAFYPLVAIRRESPKSNFGYLNADEIEEQFPKLKQFKYKILSREVLNQDLLVSEVESLDEAEIKQAQYWKPRTYEEIIFNNWD
ncbi:hypothetical protein [Cohnella sp.]|uniref:hypothetical protein n=1 Tax=Cohnella sp. TaxID=1883426 RepID=UPI00356A3D3C